MPIQNTGAFGDLEALIHQIEHVTAQLVAALHNAQGHVEDGLNSEVMQHFVLRGELLNQAQQVASSSNTDQLSTEERRSLEQKLRALGGMQGNLGTLLSTHQADIKKALKKTNTHQTRLKGYAAPDPEPAQNYIEEV